MSAEILERRKFGAKAIQEADVHKCHLDAVEPNEAVKSKKALKRKKW